MESEQTSDLEDGEEYYQVRDGFGDDMVPVDDSFDEVQSDYGDQNDSVDSEYWPRLIQLPFTIVTSL